MKNRIKYLTISILTMMISCTDEEKLPFETITNNTSTAGGLRGIAILSPNFNFLDFNSKFSIEVEEWDDQDGNLLEAVDIFVSFQDNSASNGDTSVPEAFVKTVPASSFSIDPKSGLPRSILSLSASEAITALGLDKDNEVLDSDAFRIRFTLKLSDGSEFTSTNLEGNLTGVFFSSPFTYPIQFSCPIDDVSLFQGTYVVTRDDWADYSVGAEIPVELGDDPFTFRILSVNNPFIANPNTSYMEITVNPDDGTATVLSNEAFDYGGGFTLNVSGSGTVGSCTGDISITINFGSFTGNVFNLSKK